MSIIKIIKEEMSEILNEGRIFYDKNQDFSFKDFVENPMFQNYESFSTEQDAKVVKSEIYIKWKAGFWLNENGIENLTIDIQEVSGQYQLEMRHKQSEEKMQDISKNINEIDWKFVVGEAILSKGGALYVKNLVFDFQNKTCTVKF